MTVDEALKIIIPKLKDFELCAENNGSVNRKNVDSPRFHNEKRTMASIQSMKICSKCKIEKEFTNFSKDIQKLDKLSSSCKECHKKYNNIPEIKQRKNENNKKFMSEYCKKPEYKQKKKEYDIRYLSNIENKRNKKISNRKRKLLNEYDLTLEQYDKILIIQNHKCAICNKETKEIRNFVRRS